MTKAFAGEGERVGTAGAEMPDLRTYLRVLWRWKFLLLAFLVSIPVAAYLYERGRPKVYESSALVAITGGQSTGVAALLNQVVYSGTDTTDLLIDARLLTTPTVARDAARFVHPRPADPASLAGSVSTSTDQSTGFLTITASSGAPRLAAEIANAFARALVVDQRRALLKQVSAAIAQLQAQIALTTNHSSKTQLSQQLARFEALRASQGAGVELIERAGAPGSPVAPRVERSVILALIAALLLGLGAVALAELSDRRIRHPDEVGDSMDLGHVPGLPSLGAIPISAFSAGHTSESEESFVTLRASVTYFNVDRRISSVLITSPGKEDGKTTVAVGLAEALTRAGKEVILLDADLRRPAVAARLGIASSGGLGAVLVGAMTLDEALLEQPSQNGHAGRLLVLPAGVPPPNPSELLGSLRMRELLSELSARADILLIDSSPLLTVSDSMPLVQLVSGVVLIARLNRTSRDAMTRLRFVVRAAGGNALGVVTTGAASGGLYVAPGYGYETAANSDGQGGSADGRRLRLRRRGHRAAAGK